MTEPEASENETPSQSGDTPSQSGDTPVLAELVETAKVVSTDVADNSSTVMASHPYYATAQFENNLQNISALGGAVGGLVLGGWSIICSLITYYGFINAILAILLGIYGLSSNRKKMSVIGIVLGVCGLLLCLMEINQSLSNYFLDRQELENF